jgi:hypothetical protein
MSKLFFHWIATLSSNKMKIHAIINLLSEDPGNTVGNLTEVPNQSSENFDAPAPNPTQGGKPRT